MKILTLNKGRKLRACGSRDWLPGMEMHRNYLEERMMVVAAAALVRSRRGGGGDSRESILVEVPEDQMTFSCTLVFTETGKILAASLCCSFFGSEQSLISATSYVPFLSSSQ